ncbi:ABC transporter ATP-binding protein [Nonomuraea sp. NPDC048901]|uniref:ABC transporter ATP-binding protein n=1 Tax=Nonomuraea sp. NPDC048901 TaxID=3155627 RepID=UPI0033FC7A04
MTGSPLLTVDGLTVSFQHGREQVTAVREVSFELDRGECLAIVGESGSGKSVTARTLMGLTGGRSTIRAREISLAGTDLTALDESRWRGMRGSRIAMVHQDALVALDPLRRVGAEIAEPLRRHRVTTWADTPAKVRSLLAEVGVPEPAERARQYPHQLSGGLRQRALIASAIAAGPELLLADEPTTALDATVQAQVLSLLRELKRGGTALLLISHDLAVVAGLADRIAVMHGGRIVEHGPAEQITAKPRHPYTRALLAAVPALHSKGERLSRTPAQGPAPEPDGCTYVARCPYADERCRVSLPRTADGGALCWYPEIGPVEPPGRAAAEGSKPGEVLLAVEGISRRFRSPGGGWRDAVSGVSFELRSGEAVGVVGESGSGKTSTARIVLGLLEPDAGEVRLRGEPWSGVGERARRRRRGRIQAIYQDPLGSFNPRHTVAKILSEAAGAAGAPRGRERAVRAAELLGQVGLAESLLRRRPLELSGGERQRVAIARALAPGPDVLVCDEPVSALDVSVQAQILDLLADLRRDLGVAMLFISHDLGVIGHVSDRIIVMKDGRVVEAGATGDIFAVPAHPYTRELLAAVPRAEG